MKITKYVMLVLLLATSLIGCNSLKGIDLPENFAEDLPKSANIDVPHILQNDGYSCATTSLAMVISYYDKTKYPKDLVWKISKSSVNGVKKYGNDMQGLKRIANHYGFNNEFVTGFSIEKIQFLISKGIPVVVNTRNFFKKSSHAVVINGYDEEGFFITDPARYSPYKKNYSTFTAHWWAYLSSPKGKQYQTAFIVYPK